jgi:transposase
MSEASSRTPPYTVMRGGWDGTGLWTCAKTLERGRLSWPVAADGSDRVTLSHEELSLLLGGIDLTQTRQKNWYRVTVSETEKD